MVSVSPIIVLTFLLLTCLVFFRQYFFFLRLRVCFVSQKQCLVELTSKSIAEAPMEAINVHGTIQPEDTNERTRTDWRTRLDDPTPHRLWASMGIVRTGRSTLFGAKGESSFSDADHRTSPNDQTCPSNPKTKGAAGQSFLPLPSRLLVFHEGVFAFRWSAHLSRSRCNWDVQSNEPT